MLTDIAGTLATRAWQLTAQLISVLGMVFRPALRFAGSLALLGATIALVSDVTRWQIGAGGATFDSLTHHMRAMAPASVEALAKGLGRAVHPWLWDPLLLTVLNRPAWLIFAVAGFALLYFGRERQRLDIFVN
ncbi:MAG: hypothetical protein KDJ36_10765 [Hyphomicrobiaceae bacterium]|nr:hypothetical protein [Hyphomicrobiaceae bacterium]